MTLLVAGRVLRSVAAVLLVVPILILLLDVFIVVLPILSLVLSNSSIEIQDWFVSNFSLLDLTYQLIAFLGLLGITLEFALPNLKKWVVDLLLNQNKVFYLFLCGMICACGALFLYTLPSFLESGWPYGSKEALIGVIGFMAVIHLFGSQWLFAYSALDRVATKLIDYKSSNMIP